MALQHLACVPLERHIEERRHLARDAKDRVQVSERPFDVELQHRVAQVIGQRCADGRVVGQVDDVHVLVGKAQFFLRANHGPGGDATDIGLF